MSEYWKSTPNYWCKHCKTYVRDTPLEKSNHEATPRHQGNLKRFIRDLHKDNERAERDKQRAKDEVARLNGAAPTPGGSGQFKATVTFKKSATRNATDDERRRQMAQLAEMGVAVPEDFRRENAMAGEWETVSQRVITLDGAEIKTEEQAEAKPSLNIGVRKRKVEEGEEGEALKLEEGRRRPRWGTDTRTLSGDDDDLDALLDSTTSFTKKAKTESKPEAEGDRPTVKTEPGLEYEQAAGGEAAAADSLEPHIEKEDGLKDTLSQPHAVNSEPAVKSEDQGLENDDQDIIVGSMFKKKPRKSGKKG